MVTATPVSRRISNVAFDATRVALFPHGDRRGKRDPYGRIDELLRAGKPVILDGGNATELEREYAGELRDARRGLRGTGALYRVPYAVLDVHGATSRPEATSSPRTLGRSWPRPSPGSDAAARPGVRTGSTSHVSASPSPATRSQTVTARGSAPSRSASTATSRGGAPRASGAAARPAGAAARPPPARDDVADPRRPRRSERSRRRSRRPAGLARFRRCRHGVCGVYGQHWGGPEGDLFGRAAKRFEELA